MQPFGLVNEETQKTDNQSILFNNVPIWLLAYCVCGVQTSCVWLFFFLSRDCATLYLLCWREGFHAGRSPIWQTFILLILILFWFVTWCLDSLKCPTSLLEPFFFFSKRWPPVGFMKTGTIYRNISMAVVDGVIQPKKAHSLWGH